MQKNRLAHPLWELAPPQENPGSASDICITSIQEEGISCTAQSVHKDQGHSPLPKSNEPLKVMFLLVSLFLWCPNCDLP